MLDRVSRRRAVLAVALVRVWVLESKSAPRRSGRRNEGSYVGFLENAVVGHRHLVAGVGPGHCA
eukprot:9552342-Alexandrium_andersonii.AAC.1